jgi:RNA polymerase sigma-70 factor (ECF subfamily)
LLGRSRRFVVEVDRFVQSDVMDPATLLLRQAATGDREALGEYIELCQADVWRFCAAMLSVEQADDATQETFVRVWRSVRTFRGDASARTWTLAIAKRACWEAIRRRDRAEWQRRAAPVSASVADQSGAVALSDLIAGLAPERRAPFVLTQLLGLSYHETADVLGVPIGTVRSRVARGRAELQALAMDTTSSLDAPGEAR